MSGRIIPDHWVYVVREPMTGCFKVGKCSQENGVQSRIKTLQTGCPYELELVAVLSPREHPGERELHARLAKWRVRPSGEWFYGADEAYSALGIRRPHDCGSHASVLNTSFREREAELKAAMSSAKQEREWLRESREKMRLREEALVKRERESYLRWRRQLAVELARPSKQGPLKLGGNYWNLSDYVMDYDLLRMIVKEAMWFHSTGAEFRRFITELAEWREVGDPWGRIIGDRLRRHLEWLAEHDPENYREIDAMLREVREGADQRTQSAGIAA